jgi:hypothetical protein
VKITNGRTYYPFDGHRLNVPADPRLRPTPDYLAWHNANVYNG